MARATFCRSIKYISKTTPMSDLYTEKIRRNADLVVPVSACPFGEPVDNCPFILFHGMGNEREQILQIDLCPQEELDRLRLFHRACTQSYMNGGWKPKKPKQEKV